MLAGLSPFFRKLRERGMSDPSAILRKGKSVTPRDYIEAVAQELSVLRKRGLVLSPADAQLALAWHADEVPVADVIAAIRRSARLLPRGGDSVRGAAQPSVSLQAIAPEMDARRRRRAAPLKAAVGLAGELQKAARAPRLAAGKAWRDLADRADELLGTHGGERYWSEAIAALLLALRELGAPSARKAGAALRERLGPRPRGMSRARYRRSLQLQLLSASSERLGVPPRPFLL